MKVEYEEQNGKGKVEYEEQNGKVKVECEEQNGKVKVECEEQNGKVKVRRQNVQCLTTTAFFLSETQSGATVNDPCVFDPVLANVLFPCSYAGAITL